MKKFLIYLFNKPNAYVLTWAYILSRMDKDNTFSGDIYKLSAKFEVSFRTMKRILEYGSKYRGEIALPIVCQAKTFSVSMLQNVSANGLSSKSPTNSLDVSEIMDYLNETIQSFGKKGFKVDGKNSTKYIKARLKDGFTIDNFKDVILSKRNWLTDPNMHKYYRPSTLFSQKFEEYLNENVAPIKKTKADERNEKFSDAVSRASQLDY